MSATRTVPTAEFAEFAHIGDYLDPGPHALEMGVVRCPSGPLHVAVRADMHGCSGEMFEWWFRFAPDTGQYLWWHPLDHVSSRWTETSATTHIGSTHIVEERLGPDPAVHPLQIHFVDPREFFGDAYDQALERGDVSGCVAAQLGMGDEPLRDEKGRPNMGRMAHICRDNDDGLVLRSHFYIGQGTGAAAEALAEIVPDALGLGLLHHSHTEWKYLATFLPGLFYGDRRTGHSVPSHW